MGRLKTLTIIFVIHLSLTFLVGLSGVLSMGENPLWLTILIWIVKFPLLTLFKYFFSFEIRIEHHIWNDPLAYVILLNSLLWAFIGSFMFRRYSRMKHRTKL